MIMGEKSPALQNQLKEKMGGGRKKKYKSRNGRKSGRGNVRKRVHRGESSKWGEGYQFNERGKK